VNKPSFLFIDWFLIVLYFFSLVFGFLVIIPQSSEMSKFWFVSSCLAYTPITFIRLFIEGTNKRRAFSSLNEDSLPYIKQRDFCYWVTVTMPLFVLSYLLAVFRVFDANMSALSFQLLSMVTKGLYTALLMEVKFDTKVVTRSHEQAANEAYLTYLFHRVRNPLNSLSMGNDILDRNPHLVGDEKELLLIMRESADMMSKTIYGMLSMQGTIEEGKMELDMQPFNLADAVRNVLLTFRAAAAANGQYLFEEMDVSLPHRVLEDHFRVKHVLGNLLSNAIKFSPQGGRIFNFATSTPHSHSQQHQEEWVTVTVSVRDEGPGIAQEDHHKLFNNFVQQQAGQGQKSGLGLSLCKQIVQLHGGFIGMRSQPGSGSEFHFSIPFRVPDPSYSSHRSRNHSTAVNTVELNKTKRTVLVVDGMPLQLNNIYEF
jgi:signal transduction histidine kinase